MRAVNGRAGETEKQMPILKTITGHSRSLAAARLYFEGRDGERPLAKDFINLTDRDIDCHDWAEQMDELREACGNNAKTYCGRPTVTYKHYVLSPDSRDGVTLPQLRELAMAWARRYFADYQVAVIYHDDNESGVMHAHVVVNNTNLNDGHRLSSDLSNKRVRQMNNALQEMALERGLSGFSADHVSLNEQEMEDLGKNVSTLGGDPNWKDRSGHARPGAMPRPAKAPRARQRRRDKVQEGMEARGAISWKAEVCGCVDVARRLATSERAFTGALKAMGIETAVNKQGDFVYTHPDGGGKRVRGQRLGPAYTRRAIKTAIATDYARWLQRSKAKGARPVPKLTAEQVKTVARSVSVVGTAARGEVSARDVCALLDYNAAHSISAPDSYGAGEEAARMRELAKKIGIFDKGAEIREERVRRDAELVGKWIQQDRSEAGAGGAGYGEPGQSRGAEERRRANKGRGEDLERGQSPQAR